MTRPASFDWPSEAALCQAFALNVPPEWIVYPETGGWDLVLVHRVGGWQIGIEAKLSLNAKVLAQALGKYESAVGGPDFRAVLVGKIVAENYEIAAALGITVIRPEPPDRWRMARAGGFHHPRMGPPIPTFRPDLPKDEALATISSWWSTWPSREGWYDRFPAERIKLPHYVPEVQAGVPSPVILSDWKIKAMRACVWIEKHGHITRKEFKALGLDPSRWMNGHWLQAAAERGKWVKGPGFPADSMRHAHPNIFAKIEADYAEWAAKVAT